MKQLIRPLIFALLFFFSVKALSQVPIDSIVLKKTYYTNDNKQIYLPLGNMSFADAVYAYIPGIPSPEHKYTYPERALGEPDFNFYKDDSYVSLGCKGQLILEFKDNGFVNLEGEDLYFFEIGPSVESFKVEISKDAKDWIYIGILPGSTCAIDIGKSQRVHLENEIYHYVRITDLGDFCIGPTPGADIDAVGAYSGVLKFSLEANLLFDTDKYILKEESIKVLTELAAILGQIPNAIVKIDGHTDAEANEAYNLTLGLNRAKSVKKFLSKLLIDNKQEEGISFQTKSYGKTKPISDNLTPEGRQNNRRVEITLIPPNSFFEEEKR